MNFNFVFSQKNIHPSMRQYSSMGAGIGVIPINFDSSHSKNGQFIYNNTISSNKSFSNPNFVNKQHPNILAPSVAGIVSFEKNYKNSSQGYNNNQNYHTQQLKCDDIHKINDNLKSQPVNLKLPESLSSQDRSMCTVIDTTEEPKNIQDKIVIVKSASPKMNRKNKRRRRKNTKCKKSDKTNRCVSPKQKTRKPKNRTNKKSKPWHKQNIDLEIMESSESTLDSDSSNMLEETEQPYCINVKSSPIEITPDKRLLIQEVIESPMSISPCHHELLKSVNGSQQCKMDSISPCSPAIRRLHLPSECESEDSFIIFDTSSCTSGDVSTEDDSDFDENTSSSEDETDCGIEFNDSCDSGSRCVQKKVTFKRDDQLCEVHPMVQWGHAYRSARVGPWEQLARDRARFESRIHKTEDTLAAVLSPAHRNRVYRQRFEHLE